MANTPLSVLWILTYTQKLTLSKSFHLSLYFLYLQMMPFYSAFFFSTACHHSLFRITNNRHLFERIDYTCFFHFISWFNPVYCVDILFPNWICTFLSMFYLAYLQHMTSLIINSLKFTTPLTSMLLFSLLFLFHYSITGTFWRSLSMRIPQIVIILGLISFSLLSLTT